MERVRKAGPFPKSDRGLEQEDGRDLERTVLTVQRGEEAKSGHVQTGELVFRVCHWGNIQAGQADAKLCKVHTVFLVQ